MNRCFQALNGAGLLYVFFPLSVVSLELILLFMCRAAFLAIWRFKHNGPQGRTIHRNKSVTKLHAGVISVKSHSPLYLEF